MDLIRIAEPLLRASHPLLRSPACRRALPARRPAASTSRTLTTAPPRLADDDPDRRDIARLLDSAVVDGSKGVARGPATRTSRFQSPSAQQTANRRPPRNSMEEVLSAMSPRGPRPGTSRAPRSPPPPPGTGRSADPFGGMDIMSMLNPNASSAPPPSSASTHRDAAALNAPLPIKLTPSVGRTVYVNNDRGMDVGRAFRSLEIACARNNVRKDLMRQRFHERPGLKRKRLRSERWRRRFKENFKGIVGMVQKMRAQGW